MPQRDPFGEPIANDKRLGILSPIITKEPSTDPVRLEAARLGVGAQAVPRAIQIPALGQRDIGKVPLSPGQRDVFGDVSGHLAYQVMDQLVNNPLWAAMPDMAKQKAFETTFEHANQVGKAAALSDEQRQQEIQRITAEVSKRLSSSASH